MNGIDIAIIVVVAVLFAAALGYLLYRKIKHKGGCSSCGDCSCCCSCKKSPAQSAGKEDVKKDD